MQRLPAVYPLPWKPAGGGKILIDFFSALHCGAVVSGQPVSLVTKLLMVVNYEHRTCPRLCVGAADYSLTWLAFFEPIFCSNEIIVLCSHYEELHVCLHMMIFLKSYLYLHTCLFYFSTYVL